MAVKRENVNEKDTWNLELMYSSLEEWNQDFKKLKTTSEPPFFSQLSCFKGTLAQGPERIAAFLKLFFEIDRHLSKIYTYAHLKHDEEITLEVNKIAYSQAVHLHHQFIQEVSWVEPELLQIPEDKLQQLIEHPVLKDYKIYLQKIVRFKPHTLSLEGEEILSLSMQALETPYKAFSSFNNADLKFEDAIDSNQEKKPLTHGTYHLYMRSQDRALREDAFKKLHVGFKEYENTLCELINGQVQSHCFYSRAKKYDSCLEAALFPHQISPDVYTSLIAVTRQNLGKLHSYMALRKKILGYSSMHLYDLYVPLVKDVEMHMEYGDAEELVVESVALLGKKYQEDLNKGLKEDRWVDRFENQNKRSGAYSSGCYDSCPYILMNYHGTFNDVKTLTHEAGHSMHTLLSKKNQPYWYADYPIFVAEVASTFHEILMMKHLLNKPISKGEKIFLINQMIEDIRLTFFRQVMFAEFELKLHQLAEEGTPLTPGLLKQEYRKLNEEYFGPSVVVDEEIEIEWARIPHFYYDFYVYQYATGLSAAFALVDVVEKGGDAARDKYLKFLSSGSSDYPLNLLEKAGIDMRTSQAVQSLMNYFEQSVIELEKLID